MSMGVGARPRERVHPWGYIRRAIMSVLKDGKQHTSTEVMAVCAAAGIERNRCRRNLCALVSNKVIRNIGTKQRALYVIEGRR